MKRVKVSTFKVGDNGKSIGETFIKIITDFTIRNKIEEVYTTVFEKQTQLLELLEEYGFVRTTQKSTCKNDGTYEKELVLIKKIKSGKTNYPTIYLNMQGVFLVPIQDEYHKMLLPESNNYLPLQLGDIKGEKKYSNAIKKVYICNSNISKIKREDILVFYASQIKKEITSVGVVDLSFKAKDVGSFEEFQKIVSRRTVFEERYLKDSYDKNSLVILFKYYFNLDTHIKLKKMIENKIIKSAPQSIQELSLEMFKCLVRMSGIEDKIEI